MDVSKELLEILEALRQYIETEDGYGIKEYLDEPQEDSSAD